MENEIQERKSTLGAWIMAALGFVYMLSPIDVIPDIPVVGWVDDFFVMTSTGFNLLEKELGQTNDMVRGIFKTLKWITIVTGIIAVLLVGLLGALIVKLVME
ncbi:YkvA family protein [Macellibacteroides fermentans]|uniref:DUF1232 domain-containing protein n=1 Tax=Macellibacteroides fermentans TaxID=879969 RepID=A0A8E2A2H2_9PORP|nr:DUF1232 domain-containing protein [Macellibacteroides fermentans]NYI50218.1 hypothetical protein [Macellibacteroides fermentans]